MVSEFLVKKGKMNKYVIKKWLNSAVKKIQKNKEKKGVFVEKKA